MFPINCCIVIAKFHIIKMVMRMKYIQQFLIIISVTFTGEIAHILLPFHVPASIYGIFILLALLMSGIVKKRDIEGIVSFFLETLPVMFVPAATGIIRSWEDIKTVLGSTIIIITLTTVIVMIVSGVVTQKIKNYKSGR